MGDFDNIRSMERQAGTQPGSEHPIDPADRRRAALHVCNQERRSAQTRDDTLRLLHMIGFFDTEPGRTHDSLGRLRNH